MSDCFSFICVPPHSAKLLHSLCTHALCWREEMPLADSATWSEVKSSLRIYTKREGRMSSQFKWPLVFLGKYRRKQRREVRPSSLHCAGGCPLQTEAGTSGMFGSVGDT